jgi:hypothetical protein
MKIETEFEEMMKVLISNIIKETEIQLEKDDVKDIVSEMVPELDELIAKKIKKHFFEIGEFLVNKFNPNQ